MAQWRNLNSLCQQNRNLHDRVTELYSRVLFPYKIRSSFAEWIEAQAWSSYDGNTDAGSRQGETLFNELLSKIQAMEETLRNTQPFDLEKLLDLQLSKQSLKKMFDNQYGYFIIVLSRCLEEEKLLLESCSSDKNELKRKNRETQPCPAEKVVEAREKMCDLHQHISVAENFVHEVARQQDEFLSQLPMLNDELLKLEAHITNPHATVNRAELATKKQNLQEDLEKRIQEVYNRRNSMADAHINLAIRLAWLLHVIWGDIRKWQNEQKLMVAGLSKPSKGNIDGIDALCDEGGKLLHRMIQQVEKALIIFRKFPNRTSSADDKMTQLEMVLKELAHDYLPKHLQCAFIVEANIPDRVLSVDGGKSNVFRVTVRILGGKALGLGFSRPTVKMFLVSENELTHGNILKNAMCVANECSFVVDSTGRCRAEFHGVRIENMCSQGTATNSDNNVWQKFAFVFRTTVHVCGCDIPLQVVSLPVILTNNASHEVIAKGLLVWDAAFSEPNRKPFVYKDATKWSDLATVLNKLFVNNTGRGLTADHLDYLAKLLFNDKKNVDFGKVDFSNRMVTEKQVIKDKMPGRKFSFWTWVWANMAAVKDLVNNEWRAGLIYGFISKEDARKKLVDMPRGTFLLRFSETNVDDSPEYGIHGYLTIAVIELDPQNQGRTKLYYVKDYLSPKDIADKGLSEILGAMEVADSVNPGVKKQLLCHLWPDTNRDFEAVFNAFRREMASRHSQDENQDDQYKMSKFTIEIFLNEDVAGAKVQRQDSISSNVGMSASVTAVESLGTLKAVESLGTLTVGAEEPQFPQYAIRVADDVRRPIASVLPQPIRSAIASAAGRHQTPVLPTSAIQHFEEDTGDESDSSMESVMTNGVDGAVPLQQVNGNGASFAGAFAAFNINYQ